VEIDESGNPFVVGELLGPYSMGLFRRYSKRSDQIRSEKNADLNEEEGGGGREVQKTMSRRRKEEEGRGKEPGCKAG
jgi:hypothetical protein